MPKSWKIIIRYIADDVFMNQRRHGSATVEEDKATEQYNAFKADSEKTVQDHALGVPINL